METEPKALIYDIHTLSTHDGPGIRTVFFFKGCSLRCNWCQNPESIDKKEQVWHYSLNCLRCGHCIEICPENALKKDEEKGIVIDYERCTGCGLCTYECPGRALKKVGDLYSMKEAIRIINREKPFMTKATGGGITVSGGEPLLQDAFAASLFQECRSMNIHTALDTCGQVSWSAFEKVLPFTNLILYDIKLIDAPAHKSLTGAGNKTIIENLLKLSEWIKLNGNNTDLWIRTPLIPGATLTKENIIGIGAFLKENLSNSIDQWELCSFNPLPIEKYNRLELDWEYRDVPLITKEEGAQALSWAQSVYSGPARVILTGLTSRE